MKAARGLTLIEVAVAVALVGILATLAVPAFGERLARQRLVGASETLALDLAEARHESERGGLPLHVVFRPGADWCYAVARTPDCDCGAPAGGCALKVVRAADAPGVVLVEATDARLEPGRLPPGGGHAMLAGGVDGAQRAEVSLTPLGRARTCSPTGLRGLAACAGGT